MNKGYLYIMVGIPGSGKSTYANYVVDNMFLNGLSKDFPIVLLSSDDIREELSNVNDMSKNKEVFSIMNQRTKENLSNGVSVIYDATSLTRELRQNLINDMRDYYGECIAVYMNTSLETALERNKQRDRVVPEDVIHKMYNKLEPPKCDEGFIECWYIKDNENEYVIFYPDGKCNSYSLKI